MHIFYTGLFTFIHFVPFVDIDDCLDTVVEELNTVLGQENDEQELRSMNLFLFVNTNLSITEELENDHNVGCAVASCPLLSQYLYLRIID